jgi:hypothetical protein
VDLSFGNVIKEKNFRTSIRGQIVPSFYYYSDEHGFLKVLQQHMWKIYAPDVCLSRDLPQESVRYQRQSPTSEENKTMVSDIRKVGVCSTNKDNKIRRQ